MKLRDILHVIILIALVLIGKLAVILWFYLAVGYHLFKSLKAEDFSYHVAAILLYLIPIELLARVLGASPFIPYEAGKYLTFLILMYVALRVKLRKGQWASAIMILLLPGLLMSTGFKGIVFNLMGMVNMALGAIVFSNIYIDSRQVKGLLINSIYPVLVLLFYLVLVSPDLDSVDFNLGAVNDTTGDFGSNQASTVLGYGILLFGFLFLRRWKFSPYKLVDAGFLLITILWCLLSFSRGGMLGAVLSIGSIVALNMLEKRRANQRKIKFSSVIMVIVALIFSFIIANEITGGNLLLRYQGETRGTLLGSKDKSLDQLTTGRLSIFLRDIDIFLDHPVFGVGAGQAAVVGAQEYGNDKIAHVELSRLLSEHGILGAIIIFLVFVYPFLIALKEKGSLKRSWMMAFLVLSLFSTMHAATRTMISPILFGLAFININEEK